MTAAAGAAESAVGQETGGQYEQAGGRIGVAGFTGGESGGVPGQDLGATRMIRGQPVGVRLVEWARRELIGHVPDLISYPSAPTSAGLAGEDQPWSCGPGALRSGSPEKTSDDRAVQAPARPGSL